MATDPVESPDPLQLAVRYRFGAMAFHWAMFVLVVIVGVLGLLHDSWPEQSQAFWINVHALIGILLWLVLLARFGYRLRHSPPTLPTDIGAFSRRLSSPVHLALYALMFLIPIIGFVTFIYHGRIGKGTGLGLSMVYGLTAQSGGFLRINSAPQMGTTIELWLPRSTTNATKTTYNVERLAPAPDSRLCRVLVVDDDNLVLAGTAALIDDLGHSSIEAHSGAEALATLAAGVQVDVVLTDHGMPGMSGLQLAQRIKDLYPQVPIVLATGYAELPAHPSTLGVVKLTKPCSQQEIAMAIHSALESRPSGDQRAELRS